MECLSVVGRSGVGSLLGCQEDGNYWKASGFESVGSVARLWVLVRREFLSWVSVSFGIFRFSPGGCVERSVEDIVAFSDLALLRSVFRF